MCRHFSVIKDLNKIMVHFVNERIMQFPCDIFMYVGMWYERPKG